MPPVSSIWIPIAEGAQLVHELQPDALADILGIGVAQPVPAADGPDQRGVPLHQRVPRLPVAIPGAGHQVGDQRVITPADGILSKARVRDHGLLLAAAAPGP